MQGQEGILVVEDDSDIRESLKEVLEVEGYQVDTAANGQEAIHALHRAGDGAPRYCVILLDLMMPVMNGWEFLSAVQKDASLAAIPVIVVTAAGEAGSVAGTAAFLRKPIDLVELLSAVRAHCRS